MVKRNDYYADEGGEDSRKHESLRKLVVSRKVGLARKCSPSKSRYPKQ